MLELGLSALLMVVVYYLYRWGVRVIFGPPEVLHSLNVGPVSRETPEEALYAAKRKRRRMEHEYWDAELEALTRHERATCSCREILWNKR